MLTTHGAHDFRASGQAPEALRLCADAQGAWRGTNDDYHAIIDWVIMDALPYGDDQLIDAAMARSLHADACRGHALVAWIIMWDLPAYPERFAARLATDGPSPYVLLADTLAGIQEQLPPGLVRSERQPVDPPEVVEIWFAEPCRKRVQSVST